MRSPVPVRRGLDVATPFLLYRAVGRRPSAVWVDEHRRPTRSDDGRYRLWDLVFEEWLAQPGDQLQDRQGSLMLVTKAGDYHAVQLTRPEPRSVNTAFTQADRTLSADWAIIDRLLSEGALAVGSIRRIKQPPFNPAQVKFEEGHPLVIAAEEASSAAAHRGP